MVYRFLNFNFSFTTKKQKIAELTDKLNTATDLLNQEYDRMVNANDEISELKTELSLIKNKPKVVENYYMIPDYRILYPTFIDYWDAEWDNKYYCWELFKITRNEKLTKMLFEAILDYDFNDIEKFMQETNWFWQDRKRSPNKFELLKTIIGLAVMHLNKNNEIELPIDGKNHIESSTGGFHVRIVFDDNNEPEKLLIFFNKSHAYID